MVVWKAVSNTPTMGTLGRMAIAASMPTMLGGLCSGASWMLSLRVWTTASVIRTEPVNVSPPWTTR